MEETTADDHLEPDPSPLKMIDGKDELNLAEFPLCAISDRLTSDQKTIHFEDRIWDNNRGETITRQLTITGSDEYGLPTAHDDEVLLGLIQLTRLQDFSSRRISFSRYRLIQVLGWRDESKTYERLERSLNRWVGVTLYYKNAWWSRQDKCWVDEKFHVLDNVTLYDRDTARRRREASGQAHLPLSSFVWNDVLFRSFAAGNLKSIDFDLFRSLESAVAKRLYRFLDKRFFHRDRWQFNLKELCWAHIGLARSYDAANLKRKLKSGLIELEARGFVRPMTDEERFQKIRSGEWTVLVEKARAPAITPVLDRASSESSALQEALVRRGVTPSTATETVRRHPADRIQAQLEVFDWLVEQHDPKVSRNPAGFLVASIKGEYAPPRDFLPREERERRAQQAVRREEGIAERERKREAIALATTQQVESSIEQFWQGLSAAERARLEHEALASATSLQQDLMAGDGSLSVATRKTILDAFALRCMHTEG